MRLSDDNVLQTSNNNRANGNSRASVSAFVSNSDSLKNDAPVNYDLSASNYVNSPKKKRKQKTTASNIHKRRTNSKKEQKRAAKRAKRAARPLPLKILAAIGKFFGLIFLTLAIAGIILSIFLAIKLNSVREDALAIMAAAGDDAFKANLSSIVYDADGNEITTFSNGHVSFYTEYEDIPEIVRLTFVVSEDRKFYSHDGVDLKAVTRAFVIMMDDYGGPLNALKALLRGDSGISQGGSTITQQLARTVYLSNELSVSRKVKEIFIALELEDTYSKDEIMEYYINNIYFGNNCYGIEAAARKYFSKSVCDLTEPELIFLCAIPNNPTVYDPVTSFDNTYFRYRLLVKQLYENSVIDEALFCEWYDTEIVLNIKQTTRNNYVDTYVKYCATIELMELQGFSFQYDFDTEFDRQIYLTFYQKVYKQCNALLFTEGYRIYTSIDMDMQDELQQTIDEHMNETDNSVDDDGIYMFQSSGVCIDNDTGLVVAIVGGRTADYNGYTINRAYQSHRQPGSAIKPLIVYTPAFEAGFTPDTIAMDEKTEDGPKNISDYYAGSVTLRTAISLSLNTVAWKIMQYLTVDKALFYLYRLEFSRIVKEDYVPAASIGGFTYGVSTKEMAAGYAAIANDGIYRQATCIKSILDKNCEVVVKDAAQASAVYERNACRMMTSCLKTAVTSGTGANLTLKNAIYAAKTGTTDNYYDKWMVGYSAYYTLAIWVGYDYPKTVATEYNEVAKEIWADYMESVHEGLELVDFPDYTTPYTTIDNLDVPEEVTVNDDYDDTGTNDEGYVGEDDGSYTGADSENSGTNDDASSNEGSYDDVSSNEGSYDGALGDGSGSNSEASDDSGSNAEGENSA